MSGDEKAQKCEASSNYLGAASDRGNMVHAHVHINLATSSSSKKRKTEKKTRAEKGMEKAINAFLKYQKEADE